MLDFWANIGELVMWTSKILVESFNHLEFLLFYRYYLSFVAGLPSSSRNYSNV